MIPPGKMEKRIITQSIPIINTIDFFYCKVNCTGVWRDTIKCADPEQRRLKSPMAAVELGQLQHDLRLAVRQFLDARGIPSSDDAFLFSSPNSVPVSPRTAALNGLLPAWEAPRIEDMVDDGFMNEEDEGADPIPATAAVPRCHKRAVDPVDTNARSTRHRSHSIDPESNDVLVAKLDTKSPGISKALSDLIRTKLPSILSHTRPSDTEMSKVGFLALLRETPAFTPAFEYIDALQIVLLETVELPELSKVQVRTGIRQIEISKLPQYRDVGTKLWVFFLIAYATSIIERVGTTVIVRWNVHSLNSFLRGCIRSEDCTINEKETNKPTVRMIIYNLINQRKDRPTKTINLSDMCKLVWKRGNHSTSPVLEWHLRTRSP